jgi:carboxylate-amine ligase
MLTEPSFTLGLEEEYLLVDKVSRDLVKDPPAELLAECEKRLPGQVSPEFLRSQIEVATKVCETFGEARTQLAHLRRTIAEVAGEYGMAPIAASTHPFATWDAQKATARERYITLQRDLQGVGRRLVICGLHAHVGIDDDELRIDLMNQVSYFLPHLLALSSSSPFWRGEDTGLASFRVSVFDGLPRTGIPERFESWSEYRRHVGILVQAGLIEDASKLWWDVRPSERFPTLEMRISDICTRLDDGIAVAAIYRCLLRMLWRLKRKNQRWRIYARMLINENRWRAERYGLDEPLVDYGKRELVPYPELLEEIIALVGDDAAHFGCRAEVAHARRIVERGTSAHAQRRIYAEAIAGGADKNEALRQVVDWLIAETLKGL